MGLVLINILFHKNETFLQNLDNFHLPTFHLMLTLQEEMKTILQESVNRKANKEKAKLDSHMMYIHTTTVYKSKFTGTYFSPRARPRSRKLKIWRKIISLLNWFVIEYKISFFL